MQKIHRKMTIKEILSIYPQKAQKIAQEMGKAGLQCAGCNAATWETLEAGILGHGMPPEMIDHLEKRLNEIILEQSDPNTITITERAAKKYREILEAEGKPHYGIRFNERLAGCSGFEYELDFSEKALPEDKVFSSQGIEIHIDRTIIGRLIGSEIDYVDALQNSGFKITNPNVRSSCGCGSSHGY